MASNLQYNDVQSTATLPDAIRTIYSSDLEMTAKPLLVFDQFAERKNEFALEKGVTTVWNVIRNLPPTIGALSETVDVDTQQLQSFPISMTIYEYGNALGTTEKLNLVSYWGPIRDLVRLKLGPQMGVTLDRLARNAAWSGAPKKYAGGRANRAALTAADTVNVDTIKAAAHSLLMNRVMQQGGSYVAVVHPSVLFDLREDPLWENPGVYQDSNRLLTGEVGRLFGVRFVVSTEARLPNAGNQVAQTTLTGAHGVNSSILTVGSTTNILAGDELTIFASAQSTPDGTGVSEEPVIVKTVDSGTQLTLEYATSVPHASGDKVRSGLDIFPVMFLGSENPYGKAVVQPPEIRIPNTTDKLGRFRYVGWYTLMGYGVLRNWTYLVVEAAASQDSKFIFGF